MMEAQTWEAGFGSITGLEHQEFPVAMHDGLVPKRLQSRDCGMVGFIKSLVDLAGEDDIRPTIAVARTRTRRIRSLEICFGIAIAEKAKYGRLRKTRVDEDDRLRELPRSTAGT